MTRIGLVRHGQTDYNLRGLFQGSSDMPLNDTGREQAHHALDSLAGDQAITWDAVVTSPLQRAEDTGRIIAEDHAIPFAGTDPRLVEIDWGVAEGQPVDAMEEQYPGRSFPGREELQDVADRAAAAIDDMADARPGQDVLVVAHGTLIRLLLSGVTREHLPSIPNGTLSLIEIDADSWRVTRVAGEAVDLPARDVPRTRTPRFDLGGEHLRPHDLTAGRD